jgi:hypothetical protein
MAKKNDDPSSAGAITTVEELAAVYPELCDQLAAQAQSRPEPETAEHLKVQYPGLCDELADQAREQLVSEIDNLTVERAQEKFPALVRKLATPVVRGLDPKKGFVLAADDPYAAGTARYYAGLAGCSAPPLPALLPFRSQATKAAIESYIIRASAGGDDERVATAKEALARCR